MDTSSHHRPAARIGAIGGAAVLALALAACTDNGGGTRAADGDAWCSDISIAAFPGGPEGGPFASIVHKGYLAAEADLGPDVTYYFSNWDEETMIAQFREAMALNPDGMAVMGHPGDAAMDPLIDEAYAADIQVTVVNVELPAAQSQHAADGLGYVGAPNYAAGKRLADEAVARSGVQAGEQAFVWGLVAQAGRGERTQGIIDGFEEAGLEVVYLEIDPDTNADPQAGVPAFTGLMAANPDVSIVVTDHGALTATAETYTTAAGLSPDDVYFAGFDLSNATVDAITNGYVDLIIDQQPFLQGYLPILQICLTQVYGFSGLAIDTAGSFIDASNIDLIGPLAEEGIR